MIRTFLALSFCLFCLQFSRADEVNGWSALHEAVYNDNAKLVKEILKKKDTDIDAKSKAGISPLHIAVKNRDLEIVKILVKNGANIDIQDGNGLTPLHYAVGQRRYEIVKYLIFHGADVNVKNVYGITPLHQAAFSGDMKTVEFLINAGADVSAKNLNGSTPYDIAKAKRRYGIASYLYHLEKGAKDEIDGKR